MVSVPVKAAAATASLTLALTAASATAFADTQFQAEEHTRTTAQQASRAPQGLPGPQDPEGLPGLHDPRGPQDPEGLPGLHDPRGPQDLPGLYDLDLPDLVSPQDLLGLQSPHRAQSLHGPQSPHGLHAPQTLRQGQALRLAMVQAQVRHRRAKLIAGWKARASRAVRYAYRQRGRPYVYGGTGRRGFDCSGLVQQSWRHAGVRLARMARSQFHTIRKHVSPRRLRPGDLVFFRGLGHVGMYVGHGRFIHSPHTGDHVRVARFDRYYRQTFVGATRPAWHPLPRIPRIL